MDLMTKWGLGSGLYIKVLIHYSKKCIISHEVVDMYFFLSSYHYINMPSLAPNEKQSKDFLLVQVLYFIKSSMVQ
jgi:hypothetical protein